MGPIPHVLYATEKVSLGALDYVRPAMPDASLYADSAVPLRLSVRNQEHQDCGYRIPHRYSTVYPNTIVSTTEDLHRKGACNVGRRRFRNYRVSTAE